MIELDVHICTNCKSYHFSLLMLPNCHLCGGSTFQHSGNRVWINVAALDVVYIQQIHAQKGLPPLPLSGSAVGVTSPQVKAEPACSSGCKPSPNNKGRTTCWSCYAPLGGTP